MHKIQGFHCFRFDTALLTQIIATDVNIAVSRLRREKGIVINVATERTWVAAVLHEVEQSVLADVNTYALLPSVIQGRITAAIQRLTTDEAPVAADLSETLKPITQKRFSRIRLILTAWRRCLFEKQLE